MTNMNYWLFTIEIDNGSCDEQEYVIKVRFQCNYI